MRNLLTIVFAVAAAYAQPSDAQIKKDLMNPGVLSITFTKSTGTKSWNTSTKVFEYARGAHITRSTEMPGVKLLVIGDAVYQSYSGVYKYWKFRVTENRYDGIPNPTEGDVISVLSKEWPNFYGHQQTMIVALTKQPRLAAEPGWMWHSPNSVSMKLTAAYDRIQPGQTMQESVEQDFEVRLYRDNMKGAWLRFLSSAKGDARVLATKQLTPTQASKMPRMNLQLANAAAAQKMNSLPAVNVPAYGSAKELVEHVYRVLRDGDANQFEALLRKTLAPRMFDGDGPALRADVEGMIKQTALNVYGDDVKFKDQYPAALTLNARMTTRSHHYFLSCFQNVASLIAVENFNGVWKITQFDLRVDQAAGKCR